MKQLTKTTRKEVVKKQNTNAELLDLIASLKIKKLTKKMKQSIVKHLKEDGREYVRWNILYANEKAKRSYATFLQKALQENWAEKWQEEEKEQIKAKEQCEFMEQQCREKKQREIKRKEKLEEKKRRFIVAVSNLGEEIKKKKLQEAEKYFPPKLPGRSLNVHIKFVKLLCEHLRFSKKLAEIQEVLDSVAGK